MREILFRGKYVVNGEWVEGYYVRLHDSKGHESHRIYTGYAETDCGDFYPDWFEVDPATVGQYTGLTANGKKIFEGDVCRVTRPCVLAYGKITFENGCFWFVDDGPGGMLRLCDAKMNGFQIEVIGNIHDNPELLAEVKSNAEV